MAQKTGSRAEPTRTTTITVTDLRTDLRKHLELAHYSGKHFLVERSHEPFVVILGIEEYRRLVRAAEEGK
jgi:hypothetical protein